MSSPFWDSLDKDGHSLAPRDDGDQDPQQEASPYAGAEEGEIEDVEDAYEDAEDAPLDSPGVDLGKNTTELKKKILIYGGTGILLLFLLMTMLGGNKGKTSSESLHPTTTNYGPATAGPTTATTPLYTNPQAIVDAAAQFAKAEYAGKGLPNKKQLSAFLHNKLGLPVSTANGTPKKGTISAQLSPDGSLSITYQDPKSDLSAFQSTNIG